MALFETRKQPGKLTIKVYIAGTYRDETGFGSQACYWVNGVRYELEGDGRATDIAVSGDDVYVAGYASIGGNWQACYWKNGTRTDLSNGGYSSASDIYVSGNDVYVSGYWDDELGIGAPNACYWLNGIRHMLSLPENAHPQNSAHTIAVSGSNIYILGEYFASISDINILVGCYWRNGVRTDYQNSGLSDISFMGSDPYIVGHFSETASSNSKACYWYNGARTALSGEGSNPAEYFSSAEFVSISGTDVYILGRDSAGFCYWINGTRHDLPSGVEYTNAIVVK
jgi:hypothetical protein